MANLIRLKQIEGSTQLEAAVSAGNAISQSGGNFQIAISNAVSASIQTSLSSSITDIVSSSLSGALSLIATDVEVSAVSASIAATERGFVTTGSFNLYTASLGDIYATDLEVYQTASAIIDQGEF